MSRIGVIAVAALLALGAGTAHAQTSTAPGQEKKEAGATAAKEYAPGQETEKGKAEDAKKKPAHEKKARHHEKAKHETKSGHKEKTQHKGAAKEKPAKPAETPTEEAPAPK